MKTQTNLITITIYRFLLIILILALQIEAFPAEAVADKSDITGKVIDAEIEAPVEYANIAVYSKADSSLVTGTISNADGTYLIEKLPEGEYYVKVDFIGYKPSIINDLTVAKKNSKIDMGTVSIEPNMEVLGDVDVVAQKRQQMIKADKKVLNVEKNLSATGGTAIDALKVSPSITVNQDGKVLLRGSMNFKVLIDGKPSTMSANDALKQMPAGRIENIEIITNPSAKYDAEGSAGIINIITKKGLGVDTSGQLNATAGTGNKYNSDFNLNYSNDKVNVTLGAKWKDEKSFYNMDELIETMKDGKKRSNEIDFYRLQTTKDKGANLTIDYKLNEKNNLVYSTEVGSADLFIDANFKYDESTEGLADHNYVFEDLHMKLLADYWSNNLNHTYTFNENSSWTNAIFYSRINYLFSADQARYKTDQNFAFANVSPYYRLHFDNENSSSEIKAKSDYSFKGKDGGLFETGAQYHKYNRYLDLQAKNLNVETEQWQADRVFTNEFEYDEQIYSAYGNYSSEFNGFTYNVGLRLEYTDRLIESFTIDEQYKYEKLNYFPSLSISKEVGEGKQLVLNYNRRINRPDEYFLNPFPDVSNEFQKAYGNPLLRPDIVDSYELSFQKQFGKGMFSSQAFLRKTDDAYTQVIGSDEEGIMILTFDNISDDKEFGIENMLNLQATKWWSLNASLNVFGQNSKGVMNNEAFDRSAITFDTRLINSFTIGKNTSAQLMAFYFHDRLGNSIGNVSRFYWVDVSIQHQMLNDRLTLTLQAKDVFNTQQTVFDINRDDYRFYVHRKPEYPIIMFSASYKFNNYKETVKSVKTKLKI